MKASTLHESFIDNSVSKSANKESPTYASSGKWRLTYNNESKLADSLRAVIDQDQRAENSRQTLSFRFDFNLYDAYKIFENTGRSLSDA